MTALLLALALDLPKPPGHAVRDLAGWAVRVDRRLLDADLGRRAVGLLEGQLRVVAAVLPADKVARLQRVAIWLDATHGRLVRPQYHPSADWLAGHGYDRALAKGVHLPHAGYFAAGRFQHQQPSAVLHELAHAFHDQVLGFDHPGVRAGWEAMTRGGRYTLVPTVGGGTARHYALSNPQEFFAELTETYFGHNNFAPFNAGQLRRDAPELFRLMETLWGPLP